MLENEIDIKYEVAEGPEGLNHLLDVYFEKSQYDGEFVQEPKYILYTLGEQKSLIKVDLNSRPFQFWHFDLLGRPATKLVKETLANFIWEKGGGKEFYLQELAKGEVHNE